MNSWRAYRALVRWEWVREMKRKETLLSMLLFSLITLMVFSFAIPPDSATGVKARSGILWVAFLLAGSIGVDRAFRGEGQGLVLEGLLLSPVGRITLYYAKITTTLLFVLLMEVATFVAFCLLYNVEALAAERIVWILVIMVAGTLGIVAVGVTLSAMTRSMRGGDVLFRILLFPLLIPLFYAAVNATDLIFKGGQLDFRHLGLIGGFDIIYLAAGQMLFQPILADFDSG
ncbi:MAG: heme exporter protein CcmB [Planctomycetota bacterium]